MAGMGRKPSNEGVPVPYNVLYLFWLLFLSYRWTTCAHFSHMDEPAWTADSDFRPIDGHFNLTCDCETAKVTN